MHLQSELEQRLTKDQYRVLEEATQSYFPSLCIESYLDKMLCDENEVHAAEELFFFDLDEEQMEPFIEFLVGLVEQLKAGTFPISKQIGALKLETRRNSMMLIDEQNNLLAMRSIDRLPESITELYSEALLLMADYISKEASC